MDNLDCIDRYFRGEVTGEESRLFNNRIEEDQQFAEEVAFYIQARAVGQEINAEEKRKTFKDLNIGNPPAPVRSITRRIVPFMAAATLLLVMLGVYLFRPESPSDLANRYIASNWKDLSVKMGKMDPEQYGLQLYNAGKYGQALDQFERALVTDSLNANVLEYAGKAAFQIKELDKALHYFSTLGSLNLQTNPGPLNQALVYLSRNSAGDLDRAKKLLQQVVNQDLEGKEQARQLLRKM
jgi:tetratricopeptide (TPR) repeat protein